MEAKGGPPDGGQDDRNWIIAWGCRGQQGPGEQVEGGNTASAVQAVEAGRIEACLAWQSNTGTREDNRFRRELQLIIGVAYGRGGQYTECGRDGSIKQLNGGMLFNIRH